MRARRWFPTTGYRTFPDMGKSNEAAAVIRDRLRREHRTYRWLAESMGMPYKRVLAEVKHGSRLSLDVALGSVDALGLSLSDIAVGGASKDAS